MSNYRRNTQMGATYFFTVCLNDRNSQLLIDYIGELRHAYRKTQQKMPFYADAMVILPDHFHALWTLPSNDSDYANRIRLFKSYFTRQLPPELKHTTNQNRLNHRQTGIWQLRYWEHTIQNDIDYQRHMNYILYNPVKHGYTKAVKDWQFSSFRQSVMAGLYDKAWGSLEHATMDSQLFGE